MKSRNERWARGRGKARKSRGAGPLSGGDLLSQQDENAGAPRPLFVFNVKLFDDGLLPPVLGSPYQLPHRYVVVIRLPDGTIRGEGPLRTRLEAEDEAIRARLALPGSRVHLVVAPDESEDLLDAFFADPASLQTVATEGARARDRYEEWRRKAGPVSPAGDPRPIRSRSSPSSALSSPPARRTMAAAGARAPWLSRSS
ncbi:MAG: hypothetical protein M3252_01390 [Actinomycetota bacterium]|nr:hypothetical protein [Actinomycetota bacterium]